MKIKTENFLIKLSKVPNGSLFDYNGTIALKTEYKNKNGYMECYIVDSGEFFHANVKSVEEQENLFVQIIKIEK